MPEARQRVEGRTRLSKSQVSLLAAEVDETVQQFRTRPLDAGPYAFVVADALVLEVRECGVLSRVPRTPAPARLSPPPSYVDGAPRSTGVGGRIALWTHADACAPRLECSMILRAPDGLEGQPG